MSKLTTKHLVWLVVVLALAALVVLPLTRAGFFVSDDGDWMIIRLSAFYQSWRERQFPVRFLGRLNSSYGYPVANFLYPGYLYLGSLLHLTGISFVGTVKTIFFGSVLVGSVGSFLWLRRRFGALSSTVGALGYAWSPYLLFDIYKRGSVGEVLAMGIMPVALWAMETNRLVVFALAVAGIIVSHNSLAALFVSLLLIVIPLRQQWRLVPYLVSGIFMTSFFWFPAIFEQRYVIFSSILVSDPSRYFVPLPLVFQFGIVYLLALIAAWRRNSGTGGNRLYLVSFVVAIVVSTPLAAWLWSITPFAQLFQFPYRFLSLATVLGPWVLALAHEGVPQRLRWLAAGAVAIVLFVPLYQNQHRIIMVDRPDGYYSTNEATTTVADEYLPRWARVKPDNRAFTRIQSYQGNALIRTELATTQRINAIVDAREPSVIQINSIYYPGWGVLVNGIPVQPDYSNEFGLMRVKVPAGTHRIYAEFRETIPRFAADMVSLVAAAILLGSPLYRRAGRLLAGPVKQKKR